MSFSVLQWAVVSPNLQPLYGAAALSADKSVDTGNIGVPYSKTTSTVTSGWAKFGNTSTYSMSINQFFNLVDCVFDIYFSKMEKYISSREFAVYKDQMGNSCTCTTFPQTDANGLGSLIYIPEGNGFPNRIRINFNNNVYACVWMRIQVNIPTPSTTAASLSLIRDTYGAEIQGIAAYPSGTTPISIPPYVQPIEAVTVLPTSLSISDKEPFGQFTATFTPKLVSGLPPFLSWSSGNTAVATVSPSPAPPASAIGKTGSRTLITDGTETATVNFVGAGSTTVQASSKTSATVTASAVVNSAVRVSGVSLSPLNSIVYPPSTGQTLTFQIQPANATNKSVTWALRPGDEQNASISQTGLVTFKVKGTTVQATVTTADGGYTASTNVSYAAVTSLTITPATPVTITAPSKSAQFQASVVMSPPDAQVIPVAWEVDNPQLASVSNTGLVTFTNDASQTVKVTASVDGKTATNTLTQIVPITAIAVTPGPNVNITAPTSQQQFNLNITPANATPPQSVSWQVSDSSKASVSDTGLVTFLSTANQSVKVTATVNGTLTGSSSLTQVVNPTAVTVSPANAVVTYPANTQTFSASVTPAGADQSVNWSVRDPTVSQISPDGVLKFTDTSKPQSTVVTATTTDGKASGNTNVNLVLPVTGLTVTASPPTVFRSATQTSSNITATIVPASASNPDITWSLNVPATIATLQNVTGPSTVLTFTTGNTASVVVTATTADGDKTATATVSQVVPVTGIVVEPTNVNVLPGQVTSIAGSVLPTNATNPSITWTSSLPSDVVRLTPTQNGSRLEVEFLQQVSETVTLTAKSEDGGFTAASTVTQKIPVSAVSITPQNVVLKAGSGSFQFTSTVLPANASNPNIVWSVNDTSLATISQAGLLTFVSEKPSSVTVTASATDGSEAQASATAEQVVPVTSVSLNPAIISLPPNAAQEITATVFPADASNTAVTWTVSDPEDLGIQTKGNIARVYFKSIATQKATVTATTVDGGFIATAEIEKAISVAGVTLYPTSVNMVSQSGPVELYASLSPSNATNQNLVWNCSAPPEIATFQTDGLYATLTFNVPTDQNVTVTVTTQDGLFSSSSRITQTATALAISPASLQITLDQTGQFTASGTANLEGLLWDVDNPAVAQINSNGAVTPLSVGSTVVRAKTKDGSFDSSANLQVDKDAIRVESVNVLVPSANLDVQGGSYELPYNIEPSNATDKKVIWKSSAPNVATVVSGVEGVQGVVNGTIMPVSTGTAVITVESDDGDFQASATINVTNESTKTKLSAGAWIGIAIAILVVLVVIVIVAVFVSKRKKKSKTQKMALKAVTPESYSSSSPRTQKVAVVSKSSSPTRTQTQKMAVKAVTPSPRASPVRRIRSSFESKTLRSLLKVPEKESLPSTML